MGLSWQQGPLAPGAIGRFLTPQPLPDRMLFAERLRRRMRVQFAGAWVADSDDVVVLHEPGRYPVAYFPLGDTAPGALESSRHLTSHRDLGKTTWYTVRAGTNSSNPRAAWEHIDLPDHAADLKGRVAFAWPAMDAFYEEAERIVGHAADAYHRIDIRRTDRHMVVRTEAGVIANTTAPLVLYESGFAPRWYVPRSDVDDSALTLAEGQTFCPYKGLASYYDVGDTSKAAWSYQEAWGEVQRISGLVSFEPDKVEVILDDVHLRLEPGQNVVAHGIDRNLTTDEASPVRRA